jgi:hypothetical protein
VASRGPEAGSLEPKTTGPSASGYARCSAARRSGHQLKHRAALSVPGADLAQDVEHRGGGR